MTTGNGAPTVTHDGEDLYARDGSKHLRDIEELVAKLRVVTKQLALPPRTTYAARYGEGLAPTQPETQEEAGYSRGERA